MAVLLGLISQIADKTVANTTTETSLLNLVLPTNACIPDYFIVGRNMDTKLVGYGSRVSGNFTLNVKLNSTVIATTGAVLIGTMSNDVWEMNFGFTIRSVGVSGTFTGQGKVLNCNSGNILQLKNLVPITINTTIIQTLDVTWQWSVANAGNSITCTNAYIYQNL